MLQGCGARIVSGENPSRNAIAAELPGLCHATPGRQLMAAIVPAYAETVRGGPHRQADNAATGQQIWLGLAWPGVCSCLNLDICILPAACLHGFMHVCKVTAC